jgi:hypothetical protein
MLMAVKAGELEQRNLLLQQTEQVAQAMATEQR